MWVDNANFFMTWGISQAGNGRNAGWTSSWNNDPQLQLPHWNVGWVESTLGFEKVWNLLLPVWTPSVSSCLSQQKKVLLCCDLRTWLDKCLCCGFVDPVKSETFYVLRKQHQITPLILILHNGGGGGDYVVLASDISTVCFFAQTTCPFSAYLNFWEFHVQTLPTVGERQDLK